jgi:hypothetical protein
MGACALMLTTVLISHDSDSDSELTSAAGRPGGNLEVVVVPTRSDLAVA